MKSKTFKLLLIAVVIIATWDLGLLYYQRNIKIWDNIPIDEVGTYKLGEGFELAIKRDSRDFVDFVLMLNGKIMARPDQNASIYSRFEFLWEADNRRLWFYSGDVGTSVLIPDASNKYITHWVTPKYWPGSEVPEFLIKDVPVSVSSKLRWFHRQIGVTDTKH